jgi:hypothetical protein
VFRPDLIALARRLELPRTADVLGTFDETIEAAPAIPDLTAAPASDFAGLLVQMVRRGLDPVLVARLRELTAGRPLERGLIARDALAGSLFAPSDPLVETLRSDARVVAALTEPGCAIELDPVEPARLAQMLVRAHLPTLSSFYVAHLDRSVTRDVRLDLQVPSSTTTDCRSWLPTSD